VINGFAEIANKPLRLLSEMERTIETMEEKAKMTKKCNRCKEKKPLSAFPLIEEHFAKFQDQSAEWMKTAKEQYEKIFKAEYGRMNRCQDCCTEFQKECVMIGFRHWEKGCLEERARAEGWNINIEKNTISLEKSMERRSH
jgi:hypothetical protein